MDACHAWADSGRGRQAAQAAAVGRVRHSGSRDKKKESHVWPLFHAAASTSQLHPVMSLLMAPGHSHHSLAVARQPPGYRQQAAAIQRPHAAIPSSPNGVVPNLCISGNADSTQCVGPSLTRANVLRSVGREWACVSPCVLTRGPCRARQAPRFSVRRPKPTADLQRR